MGRVGFVVVLCASLAASGCTIAGAAIGAATPSYERSDWPRSSVEIGTRVRVRIRNVGADSVRIAELDGRYGGVRDGVLAVTDEDGREHEVMVRDVIDVEIRSGTEWKKGLLLGAAADTIVLVAAVAIANGANVSIATGDR